MFAPSENVQISPKQSVPLLPPCNKVSSPGVLVQQGVYGRFSIVFQLRGKAPVMKYCLASGSTDENWFDSSEGALFYRPAAVCRSFRWAWIARGSLPAMC